MDAGDVVQQARRRRPEAEGLRGVAKGVARATLAGQHEPQAGVTLRAVGIQLDG